MKKTSYSQLISDIKAGTVESLDLVPLRREVLVHYKDGSRSIVPVFPSDQNIIRVAQETRTALSVIDIRREQALAGLVGNITFVMILLIAISFLIRRSAQAASKTIGFGRNRARIKPLDELSVRFEDVAGLNEAKEELFEIVNFLHSSERFTSLGAKVPKGILLIGPPGTGKTLLAKAIAGEASVPFFSIAASEFVELFVGVGASRIRDLFANAKKKAPCVVFIDEIDSIGRQRGAGIGGGNDEREQTLNQLLTEMDGFTDNSGVILLAATNRADVLDSALLRPGRFDRRVYVSLPDRKGREEILAVHARNLPLDESVDLHDWAVRTPGFSGADLSNFLNEAAILTARFKKSKVGSCELEGAFERLTFGFATSPLQDNSKKRLIAYHEVGHALIAELSLNSDKVDKLTLIPRTGASGGYTRLRPNEENLDSGLISKSSLWAKMIVSLGGRAAEIVVFGKNEITQAASSDLEEVTQLAREMITQYGFSKLGLITLEENSNAIFLGRSLVNRSKSYSESTSKIIDEKVRLMVLEALEVGIELLSTRRQIMDNLVEVLMSEESINRETFMKIAELS